MNRLWILYQRKISMDISDMLYILQHFNLNFIPFLLLILSFSTTIVQHLSLDYCEIFELAWKETIDKSKSNMSCFLKYYRVLSKHWQPSCQCSIAMPWLGIPLFTGVNSFVEVIIDMVCELKNTSWSKKIV